MEIREPDLIKADEISTFRIDMNSGATKMTKRGK
jgi:hypothetical protein